ncbi:membrane protein insertase YidC [Pseudodesulfovibrio senegalensis]|jgi:YidC/Oxa1 family membrane protein insertase|uniref:Membrane protein insertase YidC n=1 Tax=Pseudodesulfovibrio senegalensis TaxID=1721087 RepID=A0A6N6N4V1_9BACT|nr:membrane protein insertase YidC [Pseudodesulfovibrio senegalensis]KAB1442254.1 membrane protein insertase YidC [Pseudodesulfovibrio senegalensis]
MDNKRLILAVSLSMLVVFAWQFFFAPPPPAQQPEQANQTAKTHKAASMSEAAPATPAPSPQDFKPTEGRKVTVETPLYTAIFNTDGGILESFVLKKYKQTIDADSPDVDLVGAKAVAKGPMGVILTRKGQELHTWLGGKWAFSGTDLNLEEGKQALVFTGQAGDYRLERRLTFDAKTYLIEEDLTVTNMSATGFEASVSFTAAAQSMTAKDDRYNPTRISWLNDSGRDEETDRDDLKEQGVTAGNLLKWTAIQSNYFLFSIIPDGQNAIMYSGVQDDIFRMAVEEPATLLPNVAKTMKASYYVGPCDRGMLATMPNELERTVDFGWFDVLAKPLLVVLDYLYQYVHNYGIAIIILTIMIKIVFWPLSQKSYESMERMKKLQPMITKLRDKYGDDKQRLQQETMALYKTYKVNPAGGCMPMLLQIPVFFGLYKALLGAIELRHAPFIEFVPFTKIVWLADLSAKDPYYVTPLIMGATMFLQQLMTPTAGDPTQKKIMMFMPLVFTFIFLNFPSGLVVYWLLNNLLSIGQQWLMIAKNKKKEAQNNAA